MCRLSHHLVCMTFRITVMTFCVRKDESCLQFFGVSFRSGTEHLAVYLVAGGRVCRLWWVLVWCALLTGLCSGGLVCVIVNLRIFSTRRMNSRTTISFRKRTPPHHTSVRIAGCGTLIRTVWSKSWRSFRISCVRYLWKCNFKTVTSILANFKYYQDSLL